MDVLRRVRLPVDYQLIAKFRSSFDSEHTIRKDFILKFISVFIKNDINENLKLNEIIKNLHECVDKTSLAEQEIKFFHQLIDCDVPSKEYIKKLCEIYSQISGLSSCQFGNVIRRCLEISNKLEFQM